MINLRDYAAYWRRLPGRVPDLMGVMAVTADEGMSKKIQSITSEQTPILFYLPPTAKSDTSYADGHHESNTCIIFVMVRYDPQREPCYDALCRAQEVAERVKALMLEDVACSCAPMDIDPETIETSPETTFYRSLAGWSIMFDVKTDTLI